MVTNWFRFAFRQLATALAIVTIILLLSEILLPSSILPYFNLHILILVTVAICFASPLIEEKYHVMRYALCATLSTLILVYAWFIFGMSTSGLMLFTGLAILLIGLTIALSLREERDEAILVEQIVSETVIIEGKGFEIIREETDVFMR